MLLMIMKLNLLNLLPVSVVALLTLCGSRAGAQPIQSTDLTPLMKSLVDSVTAAEADQNKARSNAVDFNNAAEVFEAQERNMGVPDQGRAAARLNALDLRIKSFTLRLETARRNAQLLATAKEVLSELHSRVDGANLRSGAEPRAYESQRQVDRAITNMNFGGNTEIDACSAEALRSARDFYQSACQNSFGSQDWNVALNLADQHLAAWAARNRATIVAADTMLRRLELERADAVISRGAASSESAIGRTDSSAGQMSASVSKAQPSAMPPGAFQPAPYAAPSYSYPVQMPPPPTVIFRSSGRTVGFPGIVYFVTPPNYQGNCFPRPVIWLHPTYRVIPARPVSTIQGNRVHR
jgi:hypothetical protein